MYGFPYSRQRHQRNFISLTYTEIVSFLDFIFRIINLLLTPSHFVQKAKVALLCYFIYHIQRLHNSSVPLSIGIFGGNRNMQLDQAHAPYAF